MCPKVASTSPGTYILSTEGTGLTSEQLEGGHCVTSGKEKYKTLAKFKNTMNTPQTSGTFSPASLLYYHFSRLFDIDVKIPVSVWRSIDRSEHYKRVASHTGANTRGESAQMIAGWSVMRAADQNPASYQPESVLFTPDLKQIFGVMLKNDGKERYGAEINGLRTAAWGFNQRVQFQQTPAFTALRSAKPLDGAIADGLQVVRTVPGMAAAFGKTTVTKQQMVYWMKELSEISLLDYIFGQQDRIGNINYVWEWTYVEDGEVRKQEEKDKKTEKVVRPRMASIPVPPELAQFHPLLLQRSTIDDNDAGGMAQYANFAMRTKEAQTIRHYSADTYARLIQLDADFKANGPVSQWLQTAIQLDVREVRTIKANVSSLASVMQTACQNNTLQFDLDPEAEMLGAAAVKKVDCANPQL